MTRALLAISFYHSLALGKAQIRVILPGRFREEEQKEMGLQRWTEQEDSKIKIMATRTREWKYMLQKFGSLIVESPKLGPSTSRKKKKRWGENRWDDKGKCKCRHISPLRNSCFPWMSALTGSS